MIQLNSLDKRLTKLEKNQGNLDIRYKRPGATEHEKLAETLDYLHNALDRRS